jgi:hypothetical protein
MNSASFDDDDVDGGGAVDAVVVRGCVKDFAAVARVFCNRAFPLYDVGDALEMALGQQQHGPDTAAIIRKLVDAYRCVLFIVVLFCLSKAPLVVGIGVCHWV